ncbi:MAG: aminopeptidase P family protein [Clostridia bacterium]|nr:aminopeptidase P family protein [Clostridia bacterium]
MTPIIEKFRNKFFESFEGAALILSEANRFYLTGLESSDGAVLVTKNESYLILDFRYYEIAKATVSDFEVILAQRSLLTEAKEICIRERIKALTIEDDYVTLAMSRRISEVFDGFAINNFESLLSEMRAVKTEEEIRKIKKSQELTDSAFEHILYFIRPGITECDVATELDFYMRKNGAQSSAFKTISVSGKKSSLPHGEPGNMPLTVNSFLTMDFGARLDGYCSDMTRTVVLGRADEEMRKIYAIVLDAQQAALAKIHAGILGYQVDAAARDIISKNGYGDNFGHSTGHGLGIEVHERPSFSPSFKEPIPENSVMSIEPGIYIENKYGVRIEDIAVVGKTGAQNLTKSDKNLIEL